VYVFRRTLFVGKSKVVYRECVVLTGLRLVFLGRYCTVLNRDEVMCKKSLMTSGGDDNFRLAPGSRPHLERHNPNEAMHCAGSTAMHVMVSGLLSNVQALKVVVTVINQPVSVCKHPYEGVFGEWRKGSIYS